MRFPCCQPLQLVVAVAVALLIVVTVLVPAGAQDVPAAFERTKIASVTRPTALAFDPAGNLYAASQPGTLFRVGSVGGGRVLALDFKNQVCDTSNERGLLGVAVDPLFAQNRFVYLYYTGGRGDGCERPVNRVSRFVAKSGGKLDRGSERVLIDNIPSPNGNHNGGDLQFGGDGYLYASVGDGGCSLRDANACQYENPNARLRNVLLGKILRIDRTGGIPTDNPHTGEGTVRCNQTGMVKNRQTWCQEIWATGLRNPFRIAFDPNDDGQTLFINDVGKDFWEEIDEGRAGADYGWNLCEGAQQAGSSSTAQPCADPDLENPVFDYPHEENPTGNELARRSITGGAFVPDTANWPADFDGGYLFADLGGGIYLLDPNDPGSTDMDDPKFTAGAPIHLAFNEDALYYSDISAGGIFRIKPTR